MSAKVVLSDWLLITVEEYFRELAGNIVLLLSAHYILGNRHFSHFNARHTDSFALTSSIIQASKFHPTNSHNFCFL